VKNIRVDIAHRLTKSTGLVEISNPTRPRSSRKRLERKSSWASSPGQATTLPSSSSTTEALTLPKAKPRSDQIHGLN